MRIGGGTWQRERVRELEAFMRHLRRESTPTLNDDREPREWDQMFARWRKQRKAESRRGTA